MPIHHGKALTFDDILLLPDYSEITPEQTDIATWLTPSIPLRIPLLSAAMDTVTEAAMAISLPRNGHILMDVAYTAHTRERNGHSRFRYRVHGG